MEVTISGIVANLSTYETYNTGVGMAAIWTYPNVVPGIIPLPLTRFTIFDLDIQGDVKPTYKKAIVTATVSREAYGVVKAVVTDITSVIDE